MEHNRLSIIDGIQRISTIRDYLDNEFSLSKEFAPIIITVNTEHGTAEKDFEIAGKRFKKLDKELQELLLSSELQFYEISDYTEKEVRELFRRQNSGKCLNNSQSRTVIETDSEHNYTCFKSNSLNSFILSYQKDISLMTKLTS